MVPSFTPRSLAARVALPTALFALSWLGLAAVPAGAWIQEKGAEPDMAALARGEGLKGTMHGANHRLGTYIFTWHHPRGFFRNENISLVAANADIEKTLAAVERHQALTVKGTLSTLAGQVHLRADSVVPGEKWSPGVTAAVRRPAIADLETHLRERKQLDALVHALATDGSMLVVEYGDEVIPVQVPDEGELRRQVARLYRGDRIRLRYAIAARPTRPLHLTLRTEEKQPLEVLDSIHAQHDRDRTVEGRLVLFPRSPALRRAIWGVEEKGPDGLHRYFTIFNFKDLKDQDRIDTLLQEAWKGKPEGVLDERNKYVHTGLRVRVAGKVSNPAQNQANPTVVTTSAGVQLVP